jgi:hypothetical protein
MARPLRIEFAGAVYHVMARVSQAVSWVERTPESEVVALKRKLEQKA